MTSIIGRARQPQRLSARRRSAFTLIELLLVVVLMLVAAGMAVPMFVHSLEGTRLRAAAKSVATAHRYARGMAVLNQAEVAIIFDTETATLRVIRMDRPPAAPADADAADPFTSSTLSSGGWLESMKEDESKKTETEPRYTTESLLERKLDPRISIEEVTGLSDAQRYKKQCWAEYQPNGMTQSYSVHLVENRGDRIIVNIEGITGQVEFEQ